jgi:hypothetical protein
MFRPGSIEEFKSNVSQGKGFAATNLFHVALPSFKNFGLLAPKELSFLCTSVSLPSRQLNTVEREMGIDMQKLVYGFTNDDVTMTFRVLNDQRVREYFEFWQQNIVKANGDEGRYIVNYADAYMYPIHIYQLEKGTRFPVISKQVDLNLGPINVNLDLDVDAGVSGKANYHWLLERAYPVSVQQETFQDGPNEISTFTVSFSYKSWAGEKINKKGQVGVTASASAKSDLASQLGKKIYDVLG